MKILRLRRLRKKGMSSSVSRKTEEQRRLRNLLNTSMIVKTAIGFAVFAAVVMTITMFGRYYNLGVTVGFKADMDHYNSFEFKYPDEKKTEDKRREAVNRIPDIFRFEENELERDISRIIANTKQWLSDVNALEEGDTPPKEEELAALREQFVERMRTDIPILSEDDVETLASLEKPIEGMQKIKGILEGFYGDRIVLSNAEIPANGLGISLKKFSQIEEEIVEAVDETLDGVDPDQRMALLRIPFFFVDERRINERYIYDDGATKELLGNAVAKSIETVDTTVTRGDTVVSRGSVISREHVLQLMKNRERSDAEKTLREHAFYVLGIALIVAVLLTIFGSYLRFYQGAVYSSNAKLAVIGVSLVITLALSKVFIHLRFIHPFFDYPVFMSFAAVVVTLVFGVNLAFVMSFMLGVLTGIMFDFSLPHGLLVLAGGIAASYLAGGVRRRSDLVRVGLVMGGVSFIMVFAISAAKNVGVALTQLWQCFGGFVFGAVGTALATIALPVFEYVFKVTTNISLMELTDTKNPLLKRLIMETPGTYHHSLVVGNLAEAAAESVDANPLLARVASYYHDVGKLKKPGYFSENEKHSKSKHDNLIPSMSSLIIVSHVKEGVDLAIKHKLGKEIIDIIRQHHGTNLVYYFYKRAVEIQSDSEHIDESDFRYPGPKPQSKEAAIIMLADSVEAASRSLDRVSSSKLSSLVHDIITSKFSDGQLDDCDLTLKDLHRIEETFTHILMGSLHQRVKYPKEGETTLPSTAENHEQSNDRAEEQPKVVKR
jgi:putative nucleotidyltransferase with HDIG domain